MARPKKNTAEYFSHDAHQSDELKILQHDYGNSGYIVYYKLQELLSKEENHYYDISKSFKWKLLLSYVKIEESDLKAIISTMVELEILDANLYKNKILWVQDLVDRFEGLYAKRAHDLPTKPIIPAPETSHDSSSRSPIDPETHKVKERKEQDTKEEDIKKKKKEEKGKEIDPANNNDLNSQINRINKIRLELKHTTSINKYMEEYKLRENVYITTVDDYCEQLCNEDLLPNDFYEHFDIWLKNNGSLKS